jgi:molybdopterin/thiamine biosynthesis adenylyltransferase
LKALTCVAEGGRVAVSVDPLKRVELNDPTGSVLALLRLLAEGTRNAADLAGELSTNGTPVTVEEVHAALASLDELGWLEDAAAESLLTEYERERHFSNLGFFEGFTSLSRSRESIQSRLRASHVLVLGVGGLGSAATQNLVGLGVGRLTLLDYDTVELRNFARQFIYSVAQIGQPKVEQVADWVRAFDPTVDVTAVQREVTGPDTIAPLLAGVDFVVQAIDTPPEVDLWVNAACVGAGVPFVRGGLGHLQGVYWSVDPGHSACRQCLDSYRTRTAPDDEVQAWQPVIERETFNRGIGPVATMLGSLMAMEALRYLTGIHAPVAAGTYQIIDFSSDCHISTDPWPRDPDCPVCAGVVPGRRTRGPAEATVG